MHPGIQCVLLFAFFVLLIHDPGWAQPGLPSPPTQAPIDGGPGLLAAAGGVCAYKKLREFHHHGDET